METDAEIICRRTRYGIVCDWKGGKIAAVYGESLRPNDVRTRLKAGDLIEYGRLKLRIVQWPMFSSQGVGCSDRAAVMLESPHAQLYWLYREHAEKFIRFILNIEVRLRSAYRGLMLRPFSEGELMPFTAKIADRLL